MQEAKAIASGKLAMAVDTECEQEAREWCGAYFGPVRAK